MSGLQVGDTFATAENLGDGLGALAKGAVVTVVELVEPGTRGVGLNANHTVLYSHQYWENGVDAVGRTTRVIATRMLSMDIDHFQVLFNPTDQPATPGEET